jgi:hypothetical protein
VEEGCGASVPGEPGEEVCLVVRNPADMRFEWREGGLIVKGFILLDD